MKGLAFLVVVIVACGGDGVSNVPGDGDQVDQVVRVNRLAVVVGYSQDIGLGTASEASDRTLQDSFGDVQLSEYYWGVDGAAFSEYGPRDLAPRTFALGGAYVAGMAGVELSLGRALVAETRDRWSIVKVAGDGEPMVFWNTPAIRSVLIGFVQAEMSRFGVVRGEDVVFVSIEGIIDNGDTYQATLADFFGATRAAIGHHGVVLDRMHANTAVEVAISAFASDDQRTWVLDSADLPTFSATNLHYPIDSLDVWGRRCARLVAPP